MSIVLFGLPDPARWSLRREQVLDGTDRRQPGPAPDAAALRDSPLDHCRHDVANSPALPGVGRRYGHASPPSGPAHPSGARLVVGVCVFVVSPRPISTGQLHTLRCFHFRPINPVVLLGALTHGGVGDLILERASRLDAFSGYPFRTWLTSRAPGGTTGTPEVRPSRSSRTRDSLPQVSCARGG